MNLGKQPILITLYSGISFVPIPVDYLRESYPFRRYYRICHGVTTVTENRVILSTAVLSQYICITDYDRLQMTTDNMLREQPNFVMQLQRSARKSHRSPVLAGLKGRKGRKSSKKKGDNR